MKKLFAILVVFIGIAVSCYKPPACEVNNWGDITFYDNGPSWVWDGCYIKVDWANGSYNSALFYGSKSYYEKPAGRADVYMEWEDADNYYWNFGYINVIECGDVDAYCTWSKKKSASIEFVVSKSGSVEKSQVTSIEDFRESIK